MWRTRPFRAWRSRSAFLATASACRSWFRLARASLCSGRVCGFSMTLLFLWIKYYYCAVDYVLAIARATSRRGLIDRRGLELFSGLLSLSSPSLLHVWCDLASSRSFYDWCRRLHPHLLCDLGARQRTLALPAPGSAVLPLLLSFEHLPLHCLMRRTRIQP